MSHNANLDKDEGQESGVQDLEPKISRKVRLGTNRPSLQMHESARSEGTEGLPNQ